MGRISEIINRLEQATPGNWVYDAASFCIRTEDAMERNGQMPHKKGGVIGSSEWIWIDDDDALFIANAKDDIKFLLERLREYPGS